MASYPFLNALAFGIRIAEALQRMPSDRCSIPELWISFFSLGGSKWMAWFFEGIEVCQGFKECFYEI